MCDVFAVAVISTYIADKNDFSHFNISVNITFLRKQPLLRRQLGREAD